MKRKLQGKYVTISTVGETVNAFIPSPLPADPPIEWTAKLHDKFDHALLEIGRLDGVSNSLPDTSLFLYMYVRKEAVLSSQIEGTQSSLSDLLLFEIDQFPGVPLDDVREVSNYVSALNHGLKRIRDGFPMSLRLLREIHGILLSKGRGSDKEPGEFRRSQNWIGGTRPGNAKFVPPPPENLIECLSELEKFLHHPQYPPLTKAALAHAQFETIHPFLDGNGRLGRLLITLILCGEKVMNEPMLYLSLYFKKHRQHYYDLLDNIRQTGDWESWLEFFADAVTETSTQAVNTARQLIQLSIEDSALINKLGRGSGSILKVHRVMLERPIISSGILVEKTQLSAATVNSCLRNLEDIGIVREITGHKRNKLYSYTKYIEIMNKGIDI
jgi:Fic family protein